MPDSQYIVLSELLTPQDFVDHDIFTHVSRDGDTYTSYRITRFTHAIIDHPDEWNFVANVTAIHTNNIGVATLKIDDRIVMDSIVKIAD